MQNKGKISHFEKYKHFEHLSLVEAELTDAASIDAAVNGCDYVVHVASPLPPNIPKDENEIIKPAVEGAKNILTAALKHNVKRVVFTSSLATLQSENEDKVLDEGVWAKASDTSHYPKSKILAE